MSDLFYGLGWLMGLGGVFLSVLTLFWGLRLVVRALSERIEEANTVALPPSQSLFQEDTPETFMTRVGSLATPQGLAEQGTLRRKLIQAGFRGPNNLETFAAVRVLMALALPLGTLALIDAESAIGMLFVALLSATIGYYLPSLVLMQRTKSRQEALMRPLPDALDMLVSSVEAGLGLDAALRRVALEITTAAPELSHELLLVNDEIDVGVHRLDALQRLDERNGIDDIRSLVNVLTQAERYGTSVGQALRVHADLVRRKRILAAEEHAAQIAPKLTVAMIVFILPTLFAVLIGPTAVNVVEYLLPTMTSKVE